MSSFEEVYNQMKQHSMKVPEEKIRIQIPNAAKVLADALTFFLSKEGRSMLWLPEYDKVAEWLTDSKGRGLFMYGNCGRGKSLLGRCVLPAILLKYCDKVVRVYDVQEMNANIDNVLSKHIISIDDVGTEEMTNTFGNKRLAFAEIMDAVEKQGKLIIISTNEQEKELKAKYGDRILDRIVGNTTRVLFKGNSLRS